MTYLLFLLPLFAWADNPREAACAQWKTSRGPSSPPPRQPTPDPKTKTPYDFQYVDDCAVGGHWQRVDAAGQEKTFLEALVKYTKQLPGIPPEQAAADYKMPVYSCYRSQEAQNYILCLNECDSPLPDVVPSFGTKQCAGRVAAALSEHTLGTAGDIKVPTTLQMKTPGPGATKQEMSAWYTAEDPEIAKFCKVMAQVRTQAVGGRGGITIYGIQDGLAYGHYDIKGDWCNWGGCEKVLGEGYCTRTKYREYEARLLKNQSEAQKNGDLATVKKLQAQLDHLRADCPPGDTTCQDKFKDPTAAPPSS